MNLIASNVDPDEIRYDHLVRAVRGVMPGLFNPETRQFWALSWEAKNIGCPDCWAGISHSMPAWRTFHEAPTPESAHVQLNREGQPQ